MDPISLGLGIVSYAAPKLGKWLFGEDGEKVASEVVETAKAVTGEDDEAKLIEALKADPAALAEFQTRMKDLEVRTLEEETKRLESVNATMRAEYNSDDKVVKRWRPIFGYCMAATWVVQVVGTTSAIIYATVWKPKNAGEIIQAVADSTAASVPMWAVALSVVGVSIYQRSQDKKTAAGVGQPGLIGAFARRLGGG